MHNSPRNFRHYLALTSVLLLFTACEQTFQPFKENSLYDYSVYGYLNSTDQTQWLRIMPVRETFFLEPEPIDAVVTLSHNESGETVTLNDSLFNYGHGAYAWNFYTSFDILPGESYTLNVQGSSGKKSSSTIQLPEDFPGPLVEVDMVTDFPLARRDTVYIDNVRQLADVRTVYKLEDVNSGFQRIVTFPHLQDTTRLSPTSFLVSISPFADTEIIERDYDDFEIITQQIFIASAGPGWPHFGTLNRNVVEIPDGISNIEDGVGFFGGIVSKTVPYRSCFEQGETETVIPCPVEPFTELD